MRPRMLSVITLCVALSVGSVRAQIPDTGPALEQGKVHVSRWQFGMVISTQGGGLKNVSGTRAVPMDWPEQEVKIVASDISPGVRVSYSTVDGTAKEMNIKAASIPANGEARAIVTFEVRRTVQRLPEKPLELRLPEGKEFDKSLKHYLAPSPYIESNHSQIVKLAKEAAGDKATAWQRAESIYNWVRAKVKYREKTPTKTTLDTLRDGFGDCDELSSLFIALCRASGIPARMVRVPDHVYAEFYLVDAQGQGAWYPCEPAGNHQFGTVWQPRPIVQKGDNFQLRKLDPATKKMAVKPFRILPEDLTGLPAGPGAQPKMQLIMKEVK